MLRRKYLAIKLNIIKLITSKHNSKYFSLDKSAQKSRDCNPDPLASNKNYSKAYIKHKIKSNNLKTIKKTNHKPE